MPTGPSDGGRSSAEFSSSQVYQTDSQDQLSHFKFQVQERFLMLCVKGFLPRFPKNDMSMFRFMICFELVFVKSLGFILGQGSSSAWDYLVALVLLPPLVLVLCLRWTALTHLPQISWTYLYGFILKLFYSAVWTVYIFLPVNTTFWGLRRWLSQ